MPAEGRSHLLALELVGKTLAWMMFVLDGGLVIPGSVEVVVEEGEKAIKIQSEKGHTSILARNLPSARGVRHSLAVMKCLISHLISRRAVR
jgi:hypothetical protein